MIVVEHSQVHPNTAQEVLCGQEEPVSTEHGPIRSPPVLGERKGGEWLPFYVRGQRLIPVDEYEVLPFDMKLLHDKVVSLGSYESNAPSPHFTAKVPVGYNFVTEGSVGELTLQFVEIFRLFNLSLISPSLVRLWVLYLAQENRRLNNHICVVIGPFHMHENNAHSLTGRKSMTECLITTMESHKEIPYLLLTFRTW